MDSGCSKHMASDKYKHISFNEVKKGNLTFGNNYPTSIKGRGIVVLKGKTNAKNNFFVDILKHNWLSVI